MHAVPAAAYCLAVQLRGAADGAEGAAGQPHGGQFLDVPVALTHAVN